MAETKSEHELNILDRYKYAFLGFFVAVSIAMAYFSLRISPPNTGDAAANLYSLLLGISIPLIVYAIAKKATHSTAGSLFASAISAPIQLYTWKTVSQLTHTLAVVLLLLTILAFLYLKEIDWKSFQRIVGDKWSPGLSTPFDPRASKLAASLKLKVVIINGKNIL